MAKDSRSSKSRPAWANRIAAARLLSGMTQAEMARKLGVSQQAYAGYEGGKREPNFQTLIAISLILNLSIDFILRGPNENSTRDLRAISN